MPSAPLSHFRTAIDSAPSGALIVDGSGAIVLTNRKLERLFGYEENELTGKGVDELVPTDARGYHGELRSAFFEHPSTRLMGTGRDLYGVSKTGALIPVEIGLNPIETDTGMLVMCTVLDITERKRQDERFRTALDAAPNAILMVNGAGTIVLCNVATVRVFGHGRADLIGRPVETLIPRSMHRRHAVYRTGYVSAPVPRTMGAGKELRGLHASGREFPVEVGLQPVSMPDGDYVIASVVDISEQYAARTEIDKKNAELRARNEEISTFAYSTSHDLKGPLVTIGALSKCVAEDVASGNLDEVAANVDRIQKLASRMSSLVEDVLSVAKSEHSEHPRTEIDVAEAIRESLASLDSQRQDSGVDVNVDVAAECTIVSERPRLDSIIGNLLANAIKYSDPEKAHRQVWVSAHRDANTFTLVVRDNGLGIPEDMRQRVFQMFQRGHTTSTPGSGLGLTLVQRQVERLGGTIELSANNGTVFSVSIPLSEAPPV